jgi:hypothetical protein
MCVLWERAKMCNAVAPVANGISGVFSRDPCFFRIYEFMRICKNIWAKIINNSYSLLVYVCLCFRVAYVCMWDEFAKYMLGVNVYVCIHTESVSNAILVTYVKLQYTTKYCGDIAFIFGLLSHIKFSRVYKK